MADSSGFDNGGGMLFCRMCGSKLPAGALFCVRCGGQVRSAAQAPVQAAQQVQPAPAPEQAAQAALRQGLQPWLVVLISAAGTFLVFGTVVLVILNSVMK